MYKKEEYKVLNMITRVGEILLENGSEAHRVEQTVSNMAHSFDLKADCFATLDSLIVSVKNKEKKSVSLVKRVQKNSTNLNKVSEIFRLVNSSTEYDIDEFEEKLNKIEQSKEYPLWIKILGTGILSAFFVVINAPSTIREFIAALFIGFLIAIISKISEKLNLGIFFFNFVASFIITVIVMLLAKLNFLHSIHTTTISCLMILVPGVPFINSMRDIFMRDLLTGTSRLLEVILVGIGISVGTGMAWKIGIL